MRNLYALHSKINRIVFTILLLAVFTLTSTAQNVITQLYLSDPSQALDRIDPVTSNDLSIASTALLSAAYSPLEVVSTVINSSADPNSTTFTVPGVVVGTGENRGMIVGISQRNRTVTSVSYNGVALFTIGEINNGSNARVSLYGLLNPPTGTGSVVVTLDQDPNNGIVVGVSNLTGIDQLNPVGTFFSNTGNSKIASVNVSSAIGELVYNVTSYRTNMTVGTGQTQLYNINQGIRGGASTMPGMSTQTLIWKSTSNNNWAIAAIPIKPAPLTVSNTTFSLSPTLCSPLTLKAGTITVTNYVSIERGTMPVNPNITAQLKYGPNTIITLINPTYSGGLLTWTGTLNSDVTIPAAQSIDLTVTTALAGVNFKIDYDSSTKPSKVQFLTSTYVNVNSVNLYDAAYPGGILVSQLTHNNTYYTRIAVSNPFGTSDINGGTLTLTNNLGSTPITLGATNLKKTSACVKIYEVPFTVPLGATTYSFTALAKQGSENTVTHTASLSPIPVVRIIAFDDEIRVDNGETAIVNVLTNDKGDLNPSSVTIDASPQHGTLVNNGNGVITYLPNGNFSGMDAYVYSVCTTGLPIECTTATVFVEVLPDFSSPCNEATLSKTYYLPYPENTTQLFEALYQSAPDNYVYSPLPITIRSITSIKIPYPGTIIYYDHWEDGYESDLVNPIQSTTKIWGDGNLSNGVAPGYPNDILPAGANLVLDNTFLMSSRDGSTPIGIYFDGKDKLYTSADIAVSKVSGVESKFEVQAVKTAVFDVTRFGKLFRLGIGEITGVQYLNYASVFITAQYNGTIVKLDLDNNGTIDATSPTLNEGQVWFYQGNPLSTAVGTVTDLKPGTVITANQPVGVDLVLGDNLNFGTRNVNVLPDKFASNTYYTPVPTTNALAPSVVYFVNNGIAPIVVNWQSGVPASGSVSVPAKGYSTLTLATSATAAYKFTSAGGQPFVAYQIMDADVTSSTYDWAFGLIGAERLTNFTSVAWAPGSIDGTRNDNPIWITPTANTTVYVKWDGNMIIPPGYTGLKTVNNIPYDQAVSINALQYYRFYNPNNNDQSGAAFFTDNVPFAGVYGQDASTAVTGSPSLDVGTIMPPRCLKRLMNAVDDYVNTQISTPISIDIAANDEGYLCSKDLGSISTLGLLQPAHGTILINANGIITYTPNLGYIGNDLFEYRICSVESPVVCDVAKVQVSVTDCNAIATENRINGKVFLEQLPDDGAYNVGETFVNGVQVDLYADTDCSGTINGVEKVYESTISDLSGNFSFSTINGYFAKDNFDPTASFVGNSGTVDWTNDWTEQADDNNIGTGDIRIIEDSYYAGITKAIRLAGNANGISRSLTFSGATSATLRFKYRRQAIATVAAQLFVKINGTQVYAIDYGGGVATDNYYADVILPLTSYNANGSNTVQFITNGSVGTADYYWIDDVELIYFKNPACFITKVKASNTNGLYLESLLNIQTSSFPGIGLCDKDNWLGVKANMVASPDIAYTATDIPVVINVLANDIAGVPNPSSVTTAGLTQPTNGSVAVNQDGTITYTPNPSYNGNDSFQYRVCSALDSQICSVTSVSVTTTCVSIPGKNVIRGKVFTDTNVNGILEIGENGEPVVGVKLYIDSNGNGSLDGTEGNTPLQTTTTSPVGGYEFVINTPTSTNTYLDQFTTNGIANGTNGTATWTGNWVEIGETNGFGTGSIAITAVSGLKISGVANAFVRGALRTANLSNAVSATLSYTATKSELDDGNDWVEVHVASSASGPWTTLVEKLGTPNGVKSTSFIIPTNLLSATTTVRFVTSGNANMLTSDIVYFDNVQISFELYSSTKYIVQLSQPILNNKYLTSPVPSPTGIRAVSFVGSAQGSCSNNFGLSRVIADNDINQTPTNISVSGSVLTNDKGLTAVSTATIGGSSFILGTAKQVSGKDEYGNLIANAGSLTINSDGTYTFVPTTGFVGTVDPVSYTGNGGGVTSNKAVLSIEVIPAVQPGNNPPTAQNDVNTTEINTSIISKVLSNDSDPDGNILTVTKVETIVTTNNGTTETLTNIVLNSPSTITVSGINSMGVKVDNAGSLKFEANGTYTFVPATGFIGTINDITYTISDGKEGTDTAILSLSVINNTGNNTFANDDANSAPKGTDMIGNVLTNDFDPEENTQTVSSASALFGTTTTPISIGATGTNIPSVGKLTLIADGSYTFVPLATFVGTVPVKYNKCDNGTPQACDEATLYLSSLPIVIIAENDINQTPVNTAVSGQVLTNDEGVSTVNSILVGVTPYPVPAGNTGVTITNVPGKDKNGVTVPNAGSLTFKTDGTYTFIPSSGFVGNVNPITYTGTGAGGSTDNAILSIEVIPQVQPGNNPPTAQNDVNTTEINKTISSTVLTNDSDPDKDPLILTKVIIEGTTYTSLPQTSIPVSGINAAAVTVSAGSITINSDGTYTYVPEPKFIGTLNDITYTISDSKGGTDTAILSLSVINNFGNNTFANDDANSAPKGTTMDGNVLTNDFDPEGNTQTVNSASSLVGTTTTLITIGTATVISGAGTLTLTSTGAYTFVPIAGFIATVPVKYNKCDNGTPQACDEATLYLTSLPILVAAKNDINQTPSGKAVSGDLLINDDNLTDISQVSFGGGAPVSVPTSGTATLNLPGYGSMVVSADGTYSFTPTVGYIGSVPPISYSATNVNGDTDNAKLYINVVGNYNPAANNSPVANHDVATTKQNVEVTVLPLLNDSDPDGNTLTVNSISYNSTTISTNVLSPTPIVIAGVTVGFAYRSGNELKFTPNALYTGNVPFTYEISDGKGKTATSSINVSVTATNTIGIIANDDAKVAPQGEGMSGNVLTNDKPIGTTTVVNGNVTIDNTDTPLIINTPITIDDVGVITLNSDGTYIFVPLPNFVGTVPVTYTISNGTSIDQATLYLTSIPLVEATDDINQTPAGVPVSGNLLTNDKGLSKISTISINGATPVAIPIGGSATLTFVEGEILVNSDGTYTFTPAAGYTGNVPAISYTATNNTGGTDNAKLYIEVINLYNPGIGINNPPIANHDVATTKQSVEATVKPLSNDSDPDALTTLSVTKIKDGQGNVITATTAGTAQTVKNIDGTAVGTAYIVANELKFTPNATYIGDVPFTYEIKDNNAVPKTASSTINVTVIPSGGQLAGIYANDDANVKPKDINMSGNVLTNDLSPVAGLTVTEANVTMGTTVTHITTGIPTTILDGGLTAIGVLTLSANGDYTFDPEATFEGTIPVVYSVKNNNGSTDQATLYLTSLPDKKNQVWVGTNTTDWNTASNWKSNSIPSPGDDVVFATLANNPLNPLDPNNPKYGIAKKDLIVPVGITKVVGNLTNGSSKALVIPAGTAVIVNEKIIGSELDNNANRLVLEADAVKANGSLVVGAGCGTTVYATIQLYAKGDSIHSYNWTDNIAGSPTFNTIFKGKYSWQFFGVPVQSIVADPTFYGGFLREYDESKNMTGTAGIVNGSYYNKWIDLENSSVLNAFKGYEVTQDTKTTYTIKGKLMLCSQEITLTRRAALVVGSTDASIENKRYGLGQNVVSNSFTAAIPIDQIDFNSVKYDGVVVDNTSGTYVEKTVYLYNTGSFGEWTIGTSNTEIATAGTYRAIPSNTAGAVYTQIPSMQGFLLRHLKVDNTYGTGTGKDIKMTLPYNKLVKNDKPQTAPKAQLSYLEMNLKGSKTIDQLWLFSQVGTSSAFDNGWDGRKFFGRSAAYLFALSDAGNMQVNTTDNLIGTRIGFVPDGSKTYEMTIRKSNLGEYSSLYLADLSNGQVTELRDELTAYQFTSTGQSGKDEQRFRIVANPDATTWKDNVYLNAYSEEKNLYLSNWTNQIGSLSLYDMSGRKLIELEIPALIQKVIPVNLERGVYVIQLHAGENQFSTKCIIR